jgi:hypothetical protein
MLDMSPGKKEVVRRKAVPFNRPLVVPAVRASEVWLSTVGQPSLPNRPTVLQAQAVAPPVLLEQKPAVPPVAGVSIQINFPQIRLKKPQFKRTKAVLQGLRGLFTKKRLIIGASVMAVLVVLAATGVITKHVATNNKSIATKGLAATVSGGTTAPDISAPKPDFAPMVPAGKSNLATPDNTHSRYDATKQSYSYIDNIDGKQFTVSQQKVDSTADAQTAVTQAAKNLNALIPLKTNQGGAYLLTNQKYNSQTIVFSLKDYLLFIQSSTVLTNDQWATYINSLQ